jgi:hypothetical protein
MNTSDEHQRDPYPRHREPDPRAAAPYVSILFQDPADEARAEGLDEPEFFADVLLDQVIDALIHRRGEYNLAPYFYAPLLSTQDVEFRQQVLRDLDATPLAGHVARFGQRMAAVRRALTYADSVHGTPQVSWRWVLDGATDYVEAIRDLTAHLAAARLRSAGLHALLDHLSRYVTSQPFMQLADQARAVAGELDRLRYGLTVRGLQVTARLYDEEEDYAAQVAATFERFRHGEVKAYQVEYRDTTTVGHIEAQLVARIARLFPAPFAELERFSVEHREFIDPTIARFERQAQFYLAYLEHLRPLRAAGLEFCYPDVLETRTIDVHDTFDLNLAAKLVDNHTPVVRNDVRVAGRERIVVVTGPNQGGKTTYARTIGQLCHLARLGLPVPGSSARLPLIDTVYSHFERGENLSDLRGKLQDDLIRIHEILNTASSRSLIILNEIFTSTTLEDSLALSTRILEAFTRLDALCVCVTFIDELASLNEKTTSVVAGVDPHDPTLRTFRLEPRPADGRAYAAALAAKHKLTYRDISEVLAR